MIKHGVFFEKFSPQPPTSFVSSPTFELRTNNFLIRAWFVPCFTCVAIGNADLPNQTLLIQFLVTSLTWLDFLERKFHFVSIFTLPKNHVQQNSTISSILITGKKIHVCFWTWKTFQSASITFRAVWVARDLLFCFLFLFYL